MTLTKKLSEEDLRIRLKISSRRLINKIVKESSQLKRHEFHWRKSEIIAVNNKFCEEKLTKA